MKPLQNPSIVGYPMFVYWYVHQNRIKTQVTSISLNLLLYAKLEWEAPRNLPVICDDSKLESSVWHKRFWGGVYAASNF